MSTGLEVHDLTIRYGGHIAVAGVALDAPLGRVTGLLGPNGAGKTSTFNACTGLLSPAHGRISLFGQDVTKVGPAERARRGLGRTFQRMELFDSLTVRDNVALGREVGMAGRNPLRHLIGRRHDRATVAERTEQALELCGIAHLAAQRPANLSTGQRRLVELARVVSGEFRLLLLDEPSSGLDHTETARFGEVLRSLVDERGVGLLIVEHDMAFVRQFARTVTVLHLGRVLSEGTIDEVQGDPRVVEAYLGHGRRKVA